MKRLSSSTWLVLAIGILLVGFLIAYSLPKAAQTSSNNDHFLPTVLQSTAIEWGTPTKRDPSASPIANPTPSPSQEATSQLPEPTNPSTDPTPTNEVPAAPPVQGFRVIASYPHDPEAFTQGLIYENGQLYEGTGLNGRSSLRRVELETGSVQQSVALEEQYFGEGITILGDKIYQLTWQNRVGFVYDKSSFALIGQFSYATEGWGLTTDGTHLIMSDGSSTIYFLDPNSFEVVRQVVVDNPTGGPISRINELEYINGEIYANIWQTDKIVRIDPNNGRVLGWIDLTGLLGPEDRVQPVDVLNGIAYDSENQRLFVTGKLWPKLFEIELIDLE
jgi:Glutamine cyclotransferase